MSSRPLILAFDTCLGVCTAALGDGTCVIAERHEVMARGHAERLLPMLEEIRKEAGVAYKDLSALAVTIGPGTFTGVRLGLAAARGLALATKLPIIALTSLAAMAENVPRDGGEGKNSRPVLAVHDARRNEVYVQGFLGAALTALGPPLLSTLAELPAMARTAQTDLPGWLLGSAAKSAAEHLPNYRVLDDALAMPRAANFLALAFRERDQARRSPPPEPLYLRRPDAKLPGGKTLPEPS